MSEDARILLTIYISKKYLAFCFSQSELFAADVSLFQIYMRMRGFEPRTPALSEQCATWLRHSLIGMERVFDL